MDKPEYIGTMRGKDFLNTQDFTQEEIRRILDAADDLKKKFKRREPTIYPVSYTHLTLPTNREV